MREVYEALERMLARGETGALVTVVRTRGSSPRKAGAKMLVLASGEIVGTVGGGCVEAEVWQQAREVVKSGQPRLLVSNLTADAAGDSGMICGGTMEMFFECIDPRAEKMVAVIRQLAEALRGSAAVTLATAIRADGERVRAGMKLLVRAEGATSGTLVGDPLTKRVADDCLAMLREGGESRVARYRLDEAGPDEVEVYIEVVRTQPTAVVVGAGHVGLHVARIARAVGFEVVVVDDRPDFADPARFPEAERVICADMARTLATLPVDESTYVVLVTRGHQQDEDALRAVVNSPAAYVGMIGSKARVRTVKERLVGEGFARERLEAVYSPIGLDIGAETPEEIALAIVAEMVKVRRVGRRSLDV